MNSRKMSRMTGKAFWIAAVLQFALAARLSGSEIFIYRQFDKADAMSRTGRLTLRGEIFSNLQAPSDFPSYNDLSGPVDRWTLGFQDFVLITPTTRILAQLVSHNLGGEFTKFDWHFSLRQQLARNLVLILGHDSDHDADHASELDGKRFYNNRNYIGVGAPFTAGVFCIEPFFRFFHHTNQPTRLDLSGDELKQESGLRVGARFSPAVSLSFQGLIQSSAVFDLAQAWMADVILRFRLTDWLEATLGGSIWQDWGTDPAGRKQTFTKLMWGIAVPF
jgi:hypothetical protein